MLSIVARFTKIIKSRNGSLFICKDFSFCSQLVIVKQAYSIVSRFIFLYWYIKYYTIHTVLEEHPITILCYTTVCFFDLRLRHFICDSCKPVLASEFNAEVKMSVRSFMRGVCACRRVSMLGNRSEIHRIECKTIKYLINPLELW